MNGLFKYALIEGDSVFGKKNADYTPHVTLTGVGIHNKQCTINYNADERRAMLLPNEDPVKYSVKVNGERVEEPHRLHHGDRILVGSHHYYVYVDPKIDNDH